MHLPVAPFVAVDIIVVVDNETFPVGFFLLAEKEIQLIHAIDHAVFRHIETRDAPECR